MIEESLKRKRLAITQRVAGIPIKSRQRGVKFCVDVPLRVGDLTFEGWWTLLHEVTRCPLATDPFSIVLEGKLITIAIVEPDDPRAFELTPVPRKPINMIRRDDIPSTSSKTKVD